MCARVERSNGDGDDSDASTSSKDGDGNVEGRTGAAAILDPLARRETLERVRSYYNIESATARKRVAEMVKTIATTLTEG